LPSHTCTAAWQLYAAAAVGLLAFWMDQNAVNAGRLAAAQPGITLGDPVVSIAWGVTVGPEDLHAMGANLMDPGRRHDVFETSLRTSERSLAHAMSGMGAAA
jgi:hypothetical protein